MVVLSGQAVGKTLRASPPMFPNRAAGVNRETVLRLSRCVEPVLLRPDLCLIFGAAVF
jgi:hypothetical protein